MTGVGERVVVCVGLLGRSGAGACPNLPQRRPGPGSTADESAEYQRFSFGALTRSGPLQQIRTNGAAACPGEGGQARRRWRRRPRTPPRAPGRAATGRTTTMRGAPAAEWDPRERRSVREHVTSCARSPLNPRARTSSRRSRGLSDVLAGRGAFSRVTRRSRGPDRGEDGPLDAEDPAGIASALRNAPCGPGPACAMRAQRDGVHSGSRRASPARRNQPALDSRDPTSHNASPGDITNSTPPGPASDSPGRRAAGPRRPGPPQRTATRSKSASATTSSCAQPASATCPAAEA